MDAKNLRKYFLSGTFGLCVAGMIATALSATWLVIKFAADIGFVKIFVIEIILLLAGPILLVSTIKNTIKTFSLVSRLKRNNSIDAVCHSLSNSAAQVSFDNNDVIISDNYLFIKDEVAVIPYAQLAKVYVKYLKNDKNEITTVQLYCNTVKKKKIPIFRNVKKTADLIQFVETIKQKNSKILFEL